MLAIQPKRRSLEIPAQIEPHSVMHPPRSRSARRRSWLGFALDKSELVFRVRIESLQLQQRKAAAFLCGMRERKNYRLILVASKRIRSQTSRFRRAD